MAKEGSNKPDELQKLDRFLILYLVACSDIIIILKLIITKAQPGLCLCCVHATVGSSRDEA